MYSGVNLRWYSFLEGHWEFTPWGSAVASINLVPSTLPRWKGGKRHLGNSMRYLPSENRDLLTTSIYALLECGVEECLSCSQRVSTHL